MSALLDVRGLKTQFATKRGVVHAVDDVSLSVAEGEVLGLVGESGSGKSVTGYSILGLIDVPGRVTAGSIKFSGRELASHSRSRNRNDLSRSDADAQSRVAH
jgi:ABC-type dipeptide/oligopeptide/nickel transport system ATPase component